MTHTRPPRQRAAATAINKAAASSAPCNGHTTQRLMHYATAVMVPWRGPTPEVTSCKRPRPVSCSVVYMDHPPCGLQIRRWRHEMGSLGPNGFILATPG
eukprot:COSAG01_NODE_50401_length_363_cov_3.564394_1_plen_98_part_10